MKDKRKMNSTHFVSEQYSTPMNLQARIALHERFSLNLHDWMLWVLDQVGLGEDACVFEIGCGTGRLWKTNARRLGPGWDITLSDQSAGMVAQARAALAGVAHPFRFEVCPADRIPREDASVDVVIANHMLYHVPDLAAALAEIRRVLKPGGALYAATNGAGHMRELDALYSRARAVVAPSLSEGFGLTVLEGMARGVPVICAAAGALPEVAGDAALLHAPEDAGLLARHLGNVWADPDLRADLARRGLARAAAYTWARAARETAAVYQEVLGGA